MSDTGRKGVGEQVQEKVTPDSQKSTFDKATESVTGVGDKVAASIQPGDSKSTSQKLTDTTRGGADDAQDSGKTYMQSAQEMASSAAQTVSDTLVGMRSLHPRRLNHVLNFLDADFSTFSPQLLPTRSLAPLNRFDYDVTAVMSLRGSFLGSANSQAGMDHLLCGKWACFTWSSR
ncbi:MAG: hypothetical protein MMC33_010095 [Icmadophila ericetorum]|nr:hypothetical protein [Icmadophila ericetorum]